MSHVSRSEERPQDRTWRRTQNMVAPERHRELPSPRLREGQRGAIWVPPPRPAPAQSGVLSEGGHLVMRRTVDLSCPQDFGPLR